MTAASSLERILDMLLAFVDRPDGVTMQQLAREFSMSRSTVYRYVQILKSRGMIEETPVPGLLRVGPSVRKLAQALGTRKSLADLAEPTLRELALLTGESVLLTRRLGDKVSVVAAVDSPQVVSVRIDEARDSPIHVGSFGKLHLAYLPAEEIDQLLAEPRFAATTGERLDHENLRAQLVAIRRRGYSVSENEVEMGMKSISAPILTRRGTLIAALTVAGPTFRLRRKKPETIYHQLQISVDRIIEAWESESAPIDSPQQASRTL